MDWVLDASMALAWALPGEGALRAEEFLIGLTAEDVLWVPPLWWYEVSNALVVAERRGRITEAVRSEIMGLYGKLPLRTDSSFGSDLALRLQSLAQRYGLSGYDAAYLELALRIGAGLATLDRTLLQAAKRAGVKTPMDR